MHFKIIIFLSLSFLNCQAKEKAPAPAFSSQLIELKSNNDSSKVYLIVDEMPRFSGCEKEENPKNCSDRMLLNYFYKHLQIKPINRNEDLEYKIVVRFIVEKDGSISNIHFIKGLKTAQKSNVKKLIQNMPQWIPGKLNGEIKRVQLTLPLGLHFE